LERIEISLSVTVVGQVEIESHSQREARRDSLNGVAMIEWIDNARVQISVAELINFMLYSGFIGQNNGMARTPKKSRAFYGFFCQPLPPKRQSTFRAVELLCTINHVSFSSDEWFSI
jgi:hypothetical protein